MFRLLLAGLCLAALTACDVAEEVRANFLPAAEPEPEALPVMQWDFRPEGDRWTEATLAALEGHGAPLVSTVPADIETYCPAYVEAEVEDRAAFWSGLFSALAFHESTWNPRAVGGGGLWYGLTQIDPRTARAYGCNATSGEDLKNGAANLSCAVRIATRQVTKRGTVTRGMRDWGPFHSATKRAQMAAWTRTQDYCSPA